MKAVQRLTRDGSEVVLKQVEMPEVGEGRVLIKVEAAPVNPSDQMHLLGFYGKPDQLPPLPHFIGGEGSGRIIKLGKGVAPFWLNKKVTFMCDPHAPRKQGSWSEYVVKKAAVPHIFAVPEKVPFTMAASFWVNPLTALGIWDLAKKMQHNKGVVFNAGASALGKMMIRLSLDRQFTLISIVRREEQVKMLKEIGAKYVINTGEKGWKKKLAQLTKKLEIRLATDAISGRDAGLTLALMPAGSVLLNYGALSGKSVSGVGVSDLVFYEKSVRGFWLPNWMKTLNPLETQEYMKIIADDFAKGGRILGTQAIKEFKLEQFEEAVRYQYQHASKGKVYIRPHL